jgi:hypothetical protein
MIFAAGSLPDCAELGNADLPLVGIAFAVPPIDIAIAEIPITAAARVAPIRNMLLLPNRPPGTTHKYRFCSATR